MFGFKRKGRETEETEEELRAGGTLAEESGAEGETPSSRRAHTAGADAKKGETISADEMKEFEEFRRQKKILEIRRLLRMIDHTLLKQTATRADVKKLCEEAREYGFYSVCVQPVYVAACCDFLHDSPGVKIACVVGFPMGENTTATKVYETKRALADGADEIDMVVCVSAIKNGNYAYVKREIKQVVRAAKGNPVKVIIETSLLTRDEMLKAAVCARDAGAAFVKTSTGYFGEGAKTEDVRLIKQAVEGKCSVKASGGIKTAEQFRAMVDAGADRIGTSSGKEIAEVLQKDLR